MPYSNSYDPDFYDPYGVPLPTEVRIRRLMEKQRAAQQPQQFLSDELPPESALGADLSAYGLEAVESPFDGGISYRRTRPAPQAPYVGYRQGRG